MADEPPITYNSATDLSLGQIPDVTSFDDLYIELLDLHNAIETLLTGSDTNNAVFAAYISKRRAVTTISSSTYEVKVTDGLLLVDASLNPVTITMHLSSEGVGYSYDIKVIDATNTVTVVGKAGEKVDDDVGGIELDYQEAIRLKNDGTNWWLAN